MTQFCRSLNETHCLIYLYMWNESIIFWVNSASQSRPPSAIRSQRSQMRRFFFRPRTPLYQAKVEVCEDFVLCDYRHRCVGILEEHNFTDQRTRGATGCDENMRWPGSASLYGRHRSDFCVFFLDLLTSNASQASRLRKSALFSCITPSVSQYLHHTFSHSTNIVSNEDL